MYVSDKTYDHEIDLIEWILTIWNEKWKIVSIIAFSILSVFGLNIVKPNTIFTASNDIRLISSVEFDKYRLFNSSLKIIKKDYENDKEGKVDKVDKVFSNFEITQKYLTISYL